MSDSEWKKPTQVMRVHRMKKRPSKKLQEESSKESENGADNLSDINRLQSLQLNKKRRNPFGCNSPLKRSLSESDYKRNTPDSCGNSSPLPLKKTLPALSSPIDEETGLEPATCGMNITTGTKIGETECIPSNDKILTKGSTTVVDNDLQTSEVLPVDWSLKLKLRITTMDALQSGTASVSTGQARALDHFVHDVPPEAGLKDDSVLPALRRCCHYWVHPNLAWFPEFPRIVADSKIRNQVPLDVGLNAGIQKALYNDWVDSFTSIFQQLKAGLCPYFYMCCHHFTVLFRGRGIGGQATPTAYVTPTTRGLRNALTQEGVEFTMPKLRTQSRQDVADCSGDSQPLNGSSQQCSVGDESSVTAADGQDVDGDEEDIADIITGSNEGASIWLQDIGLDRKNFPSLEPAKVKIQREDYQRVDGRTESLVLCQASQVQALFNFLINFRSCIALTGPQAGIPPTVIAPTAFRGATLKCNKIRHSEAKLSKGASTQNSHVVEISGPLLPHHMLNISSLLREAVPATAVLSVLTDEHSVPFNLEVVNHSHSSTTPQSDNTGLTTAAPNLSRAHAMGVGTECDIKSSKETDESAKQKSELEESSAESRWDTKLNSKNTVQGRLAEKENIGGPLGNRSTAGGHMVNEASDRQINLMQGQHGVLDKAVCGSGDGWASGLHRTVRDQLFTKLGLTEGVALREIKCQPHGFVWT